MTSSQFGPIRFVLAAAFACALLVVLSCTPAFAGDMTLEALSARFPPPLHVQPKLADIPAWPITSELEPEGGPIGYVFESIDLAPIPGFEGTPMNLLVAIDRKGNFIDVSVLRQHEPVFLSGLGETPLNEFVRQYAGKNLRQDFTVSSAYGNTKAGVADNRVVLDGVTKATASVRIVNQTALAAGLAVARAKLGFADPGTRGPPAEVRSDVYEPLDFPALVERGLVGRLRVTHAEAEKLFAGTEGEGVDEDALRSPGDTLIELYVAYLNAPTVGRTVLGEARYADLMDKLEPGEHALWLASTGRDAVLDDSFVPGTAPPKLQLTQGGYPAEMRDLVFEHPAPAGAPAFNASGVFRVYAASNLDPAQPLQVTLTLTRAKGIMLPRITNKTVALDYTLPGRLFVYPPKPLPEWLIAWQGRWPDLALIGAALVLLSVVLARPQWMAKDARRLVAFRSGFLLFTLVFIGWYAQGQLSIVQITGAIKTLVAGQSLKSFLYDPVSLLIITFTLVSFFIWGRGTFCGWLCPFGALQEFIAMAAHKLRIPQIRLPALLARTLDRGRYVILLVLVAAAAFTPDLATALVEVEPFKTAITVGFDRTWPYVAWAVGLLLAGAFSYKFFCRFVCPLGAAMVLGGKLRRFDWLARRAECGKPCQTCRHRCEYDAIDRSGEIRYDDCFQCLDCVGIHADAKRCAPVLLYAKKGRTVKPFPIPVRTGSAQ
ncbi:MAG: 4Fe-4S binding protein [Methyloversatilis sp.]|uniref:4Fe-4S binding protein n=1 Tax=Methyloversatilis sp. TaxID=2569862 RepID=UPI0027363FA0|nr:4Fe-4S binding protein [Methyloversatilis sp.]MDP2868260.1 4Fe-4S binding protein [Methyloversatilis sp.]